ncbi:MAG: preprotein translocase subunit SecE [Bacteroidetes bacterium]|nr:MAG: preprotein translocase subunit SecE [Bacteroidota bacterium]
MFEKIKLFVNESADEVKNKVTCPTAKELQNSTVIVLVSALVFAVLIGLVDFVFENGMTWFYRSF